MDRRKFISMLALGAPAAVIAPKLGLIEQVRKYFFAPRGGWVPEPPGLYEGIYGPYAALMAQSPRCGVFIENMRAPGRIDAIALKHWLRAEQEELRFYDAEGMFPVYTPKPYLVPILFGTSNVAFYIQSA